MENHKLSLTVTYLGASIGCRGADGENEFPPSLRRVADAFVFAAAQTGDEAAFAAVASAFEGKVPEIVATGAFGEFLIVRYGPYLNDDKAVFRNPCAFTDRRILLDDSLLPPRPHVRYIYQGVPDEGGILRELAKRIRYLGDASSTVCVSLDNDEEIPLAKTFVPTNKWSADRSIVVPTPGRVASLRASYARRSKASAAAKTPQRKMQYWSMNRERYDYVAEVAYQEKGTETDPIWRVVPGYFDPPVGAFAAASFSQALAAVRAAFLRRVNRDDIPELTGHDRDGLPTKEPHIGFVPILDTNRPYASGLLLGVGLIIPRVLGRSIASFASSCFAEVQAITSPYGDEVALVDRDSWRSAHPQQRGGIRVLDDVESSSFRWATVTPMRLHRNSTGSEKRSGVGFQKVVAEAVAEVEAELGVTVVSSRFADIGSISGSVPTFVYRSPRGTPPLIHLDMVFDRPVRGPLAIGNGRWKGFGLCLPIQR